MRINKVKWYVKCILNIPEWPWGTFFWSHPVWPSMGAELWQLLHPQGRISVLSTPSVAFMLGAWFRCGHQVLRRYRIHQDFDEWESVPHHSPGCHPRRYCEWSHSSRFCPWNRDRPPWRSWQTWPCSGRRGVPDLSGKKVWGWAPGRSSPSERWGKTHHSWWWLSCLVPSWFAPCLELWWNTSHCHTLKRRKKKEWFLSTALGNNPLICLETQTESDRERFLRRMKRGGHCVSTGGLKSALPVEWKRK